MILLFGLMIGLALICQKEEQYKGQNSTRERGGLQAVYCRALLALQEVATLS